MYVEAKYADAALGAAAATAAAPAAHFGHAAAAHLGQLTTHCGGAGGSSDGRKHGNGSRRRGVTFRT